MKEWLKDIYNIEEDKNAEYGYRVIQKHNIELIEATEKLAEKESDDNFSKEFFENELIKNSGLRLEHDKCPHRIYGYSNSTDNCKVRQARSYS